MSGAAGLVDTLESLGVSLEVTAGGRLALEPASAVPPELLDMLRSQRDDVIQVLNARAGGHEQTPETPGTPEVSASTSDSARCFSGVSVFGTPALILLPPALTRMVHAAGCNQINHPAMLPSGVVMNLGDYVLACAAYYAAGMEPDRQVRDLWAAHAAWSH